MTAFARRRVSWRPILLVMIFVTHMKLHGQDPIVPELVFTPEEIKRIIDTKDFFLYQEMDETSPIWRNTHRRYGSHFLGSRTHFVDEKEVISERLTRGFPVSYMLEQLYRAKLGIHARIGELTPRIDLRFGDGALGINVGSAFNGLFGFLLPSNWLRLTNQTILYEAAKYQMLKTILDGQLDSELAYLDQHQLITEFEILNYYFIHLQILGRIYPENNRVIDTLLGRFAVEGTNVASQRGDIKLGFDSLAFFMAKETFEKGDYTALKLNIRDIVDFPARVKDLAEVEEKYRDPEKFLEETVRKSVELKIIKEFYKISQFNIGITALGSMFNTDENLNHPRTDARFAFIFGYNTLPNTLIAKSFSATAKIDVRKAFLDMLNNARRSFDSYTNSLGGFTEAKRSLQLNRKAFIENLKYLLDNGEQPDSIFILSLNHLIATELKLNNALHGSLRARAMMDRFLLTYINDALRYIPDRSTILNFFEGKRKENSDEASKDEILDKKLLDVTRSHKLRKILDRTASGMEKYSEQDVKNGVERNLVILLSDKTFRRGKRFVSILQTYALDKGIILTPAMKFLIKKRWGNPFKMHVDHDVDTITDFENFPLKEKG